MFFKTICYTIIIILVLNNLNILIVASRLQTEPFQKETNLNLYNFKKRFNNIFQNRKLDNEYEDNEGISHITNYDLHKLAIKSNILDDNIINNFSFIGDEFNLDDRNPEEKIINKKNNPSDILDDENYENSNNKIWNILTPKSLYSNALHYRRYVPSDINIKTSDSSIYPSVLTNALEISLKPSDVTNIGGNVLANVAEKFNTSTLDLAEKLTKSEPQQNNDQFRNMIQSYLKNKDLYNEALNNVNPTNIKLLRQQPQNNNLYIENGDRLTDILEKVLTKLEYIQDNKNIDKEYHPDGAPCDIIGSWSSITLGLCFDIQMLKDQMHHISAAEINNKILTINVVECLPAKQHQIVDLDWKFSGSALKQLGGPFYAYGQKRSENMITTFVGFCRTCDGIDTIFGNWNFLSPSKDCNDIALAFEDKRDVLRRIRLEMKRKERFKNLLYQRRVEKT